MEETTTKTCCRCLDFVGRVRKTRAADAGERTWPPGEHPSARGKRLGNGIVLKTSW